MAISTPAQEPERDFLLVEYEKLKDEQIERIKERNSLINYTVVSIGALLALSSTGAALRNVLFAIPWIGIVFGLNYLRTDAKVSDIGSHLRSRYAEVFAPAFSWETKGDKSSQRFGFRAGQLLSDLLVFIGPGAVAIVVSWFVGRAGALWWTWAAASSVLLVLLASMFIRQWSSSSRLP